MVIFTRSRTKLNVLKLMAASVGLAMMLLALFSTCPAPALFGQSQHPADDLRSDQLVSRTPWILRRHHRALQFSSSDELADNKRSNYSDKKDGGRFVNNRLGLMSNGFGLENNHVGFVEDGVRFQEDGTGLKNDVVKYVNGHGQIVKPQEKDNLLQGPELIIEDTKIEPPDIIEQRSSSPEDKGIVHFNIEEKASLSSTGSNHVFTHVTKSRGDTGSLIRHLKGTQSNNSLHLKKPCVNDDHQNHSSCNGQGTWSNSTGNPSKRLPQALIIGVKKAGTRALLEFLRAHPNLASPGPEPHFFDRNYHMGVSWYRDLMPRTMEHQMTLEKTPAYFVTRRVPRRVFDLDPEMKLLLVVREPVRRALSDYCQAASKHPVRSFESMALVALNASQTHQQQVRSDWSAIRIGLYAQHLAPWLRVFSMHQVHVVDGQGLVDSPAAELAKVETFLGIPAFFRDSNFRLRMLKGKFPCLAREDGSVHCLDARTKGRKHPAVREDVLRRLREFYRPHNELFFSMVSRTFDWNL